MRANEMLASVVRPQFGSTWRAKLLIALAAATAAAVVVCLLLFLFNNVECLINKC